MKFSFYNCCLYLVFATQTCATQTSATKNEFCNKREDTGCNDKVFAIKSWWKEMSMQKPFKCPTPSGTIHKWRHTNFTLRLSHRNSCFTYSFLPSLSKVGTPSPLVAWRHLLMFLFRVGLRLSHQKCLQQEASGH